MKRILFILTLMGFLSVNVFGQAIPKQINYQGILKEGSALLDGNYPFTFRIYNDPTGGSALWTESQTITVENGLFSAHLGSVTPIAGVPFDRVHFLGITIGTGSELAPRTMLTPSAYSFMSMDIMDNTVSTLKLQDGAVTSAKIGANHVVKSINGLKDDVTFVAGTNITLTPSGNNITINAAGGGGGSVTQVNTGPGLTGGPITTTGTISVPNDGITNAMLQNSSVTSAKILDGTITGADIANSTIGAEKLSFTPGTGTVTSVATGSGLTGGPITSTGTISVSTGGITSAMILDGTVAATDLASNSVTSTKILDGTIVTADLGDNSVTSAKIVDGSILNADINSSAAITVSKISGDAGIEYLSIGSVNGITTSPINLGSITISCPTSGYVLLMITGYAVFFGDNTVVEVGLSTSSTAINLNYARTGRLDGSGALRYVNEFTAFEVVSVSAGNNTFYGLALKESSFATNTVNLGNLRLTGIFIPKRY